MSRLSRLCMFFASAGILLFLLYLFTAQSPGIEYARSVILLNDRQRAGRVEPRQATELIAYRQSGIVGKSASVISNYLEDMSTTLFMPIHILWKDEQASGGDALSYAMNAAKQQRQVLLLYTPEMMIEALQNGIDIHQAFSPIALLARERICFAVRADSPHTDLESLQQAALSGKTVRLGGRSASGGIDELRFIHLAGLAQDRSQYISTGRRAPLFALLDGSVDIACIPMSEALKEEAGGKIRILPCQALQDSANVLSMNWLCLLSPSNQPSLRIDYWYQTVYDFSNSLLWKQTAAQEHWVLSYMDEEQLTRYLQTQRQQLRRMLALD